MFSFILEKHFVRSGFGSFSSLTKLPNASENYLRCRTVLMPLSIAGSKLFVVCWDDQAKLYNRDLRNPENRGMRVNICPMSSLCGLKDRNLSSVQDKQKCWPPLPRSNIDTEGYNNCAFLLHSNFNKNNGRIG